MGKERHSYFLYSICAVTGIVAAAYSPVYLFFSTAGVVLGLLLLARQRMAVLCLSVVLCAGGYFYLYDSWHASSLTRYADGATSLEVTGRIASPPERDGDTVRLFLDVGAYQVAGRHRALFPAERVACRIKLDAEEQISVVERWRTGHQLTASVQLQLPDGARNPNAFDYARYLRWQGVYVTAKGSFAQTQVEVDNSNLFGWFETWQQHLAKRLDLLFADSSVSGFMKSLLLGLRDEVEPRLADTYADLGLIHVLAISGLHVTLVSAGFLWLMERLGLTREWSLVAAILFIAGYVLLVGASPSAVRAGLMGGLGLWAVRARKQIEIRQLWGIALLLMLLCNPYQLWQVGFQLSFCVTLGLILYVPILMESPLPRSSWLRSSMAVATSAALVSFPFLIYWFHQFSPLSWLLNLLVVPLLSLIVLPAGYAALVVSFLFPPLGSLIGQLVNGLLPHLHHGLSWLHDRSLPFSHWPHPHWWWLAGYAIWLISIPIGWHLGYQRRRDFLVYGTVFCLLLVAARQPLDGTDEVRITFLDVGQGDSIVVEVTNETVYLIDGGGIVRIGQTERWREKKDPFDPGKDIVVPYLRSRGIEQIDRLVATHGDQDHIGGLPAVAARMPIAAALLNGTPPSRGDRELLASLARRGVPLVTGQPGVSWEDVPGVVWTWLSPDGSNMSGKGEKNDASVVLLLTAYGTRVLFTGDIEQAAEERLLHSYSPLLSTVDVLKVAHHGSKTSTTAAFLERMQPQAAVISVGRNNRYGHPSSDVLARLEEAGTTVFRTDRHGAITLILRPDGMEWQIQNKVYGLQPFRAASRQ
ncbi:DNA internalization-related competence protein ComEC/Rec2 [Brevibacillus humidisoli]|uniref:DNA internalization-related competence protein ComEC/Rec2 n=1 Tax=Brevibacillus humidisoli TaxID=2895522 RepID=UPI001E605900|nr:DNA internalization-related competence protein ComEC/Rec2 [Brevibacillus humidisoli]UFJ38882.1 DNA internalization-related competence protein ComEC/Rec2 [Brevibacillus humidisoli]